MRKLLVVVALLAAAVLGLLGSCTRQAGPSYPPGRVKQYQVPAGKLSMNLSLYLPGGYDGSDLRYPVLYLIHGDEGDDQTFFGGGYKPYAGAMSDADVRVIMDGLLQRGRIRPFIVACPSLQGYAFQCKG